MQFINEDNCRVDPVSTLYKIHTKVDVLRLDLIHPVISGNKWFKLKYYIKQAKEEGKNILLTFGGAYSNHIVATAAASKMAGLKSTGIIRGEKPAKLSHTLEMAARFGMDLYFTGREAFRNKIIPDEVYEKYPKEKMYRINEGGYGSLGMKGAMDILNLVDRSSYTHIIAATGTGTMLAGLIEASRKNCQVTGISVLKNNLSIHEEINQLLKAPKAYNINFNYHFGGYAKHTEALLSFMNAWYERTGIPSDFVYTGKLFFALDQLIEDGYFPGASSILAIHSGGLQGNLSLPKGKLIF
jgi:1-aminocyclopropane-1-carboxylate deaminase